MHTYDKSVHCPPVKLKLNWFILQQFTLTSSLQSYHDLQYAQTHLYPEEGKGNVVVSRQKQDPKAHELRWMCIIYRVADKKLKIPKAGLTPQLLRIASAFFMNFSFLAQICLARSQHQDLRLSKVWQFVSFLAGKTSLYAVVMLSPEGGQVEAPLTQ